MILMNDFNAEPAALQQAQRCAVEKVLGSASFILGNEVRAFEQAWADYCGVPFCVSVANGTDAIEIGLRTLDIGVGDEIITTPMTAMATIMAIVRAGATPVLADIDPSTALLDMESVARCVSSRTRGVLLVHLYGRAANLDQWRSFCADHSIALMEDCAQSHGAKWGGASCGTFGSFGAFSFYPTKNLGGRGDGGAIVTRSEEVAARARSLRNYGSVARNQHIEPGFNSRLDEMQAAILSVRLRWLDEFNARRQAIAARYMKELSNAAVELLSAAPTPESHVHHLFVVRCPERERLAASLKASGTESLVHYPVPAHRQPFWASLGSGAVEVPHAERHARECLSLPCHPQLTDDQVSAVIEAVNAFR